MELFYEYLNKIDDPTQQARVAEVLAWVKECFPQLSPEVKWNQPMFTHHGTFVIGFSIAKHHLAISPEPNVLAHFAPQIEQVGYAQTKAIFRIKWDAEVCYPLLQEIIAFTITDKAQCTTFWKK